MPDLTGRRILVTGASTGIGRAIAVDAAAKGAHVAINYPFDRERANAEETLRLVEHAAAMAPTLVRRDGTEAPPVERDLPAGILLRGDVTKEAEVEALVAGSVEAFGRLDALVNNAGIQIEEPASHETTVEHFDAVLDVNLRGAFIASREFLKHALGRPGGGSILNVSSVHQRIPRPFYLSYAVSKYGLNGLTETLALEYADRGIRVNAIAPGATRTPIQSWLNDPAATAVVASHIPMKRIAEPEEIARLASVLLSDDASYVTGHTLFADGGLTLFADFQEPWSG